MPASFENVDFGNKARRGDTGLKGTQVEFQTRTNSVDEINDARVKANSAPGKFSARKNRALSTIATGGDGLQAETHRKGASTHGDLTHGQTKALGRNGSNRINLASHVSLGVARNSA